MGRGETNTYRFNLVDFFIVVALIFAICTIVFVVLGNDILDLTEEKLDVNYILSVDGKYDSSFSLDDEIFTRKGKVAGRITGMKSEPNGTTVLIISSSAYEADSDLFIKGQLLASKNSFPLRLGDDIIEATCERIVRLEG